MKRIIDNITKNLDSNKNKRKRRRRKGGVMWRARDGNHT